MATTYGTNRHPIAVSAAGRLLVIPDDDPPVMSDSAALLRLKVASGVRVEVHTGRPGGQAELIRRIARSDAVMAVRSATQFTKAVLSKAPGLRLLVIMGEPAENVDLDYAAERRINVLGTPATGVDSSAEHSLALMLSLARKIPELDQRVRAGEWPRGLVEQLGGKVLGIIGTSPAGRKVARLAAGLGMNVVTWSPDAHASEEQPVELDRLLRIADVISVHARLPEAAGKLIGAGHFAHMKPTALFIHTERAGLVDEDALAHALSSQQIAGAAIDVFTQEPPVSGSPLRYLPNVILSPHTGASTAEALEASLNAVVDVAIQALAGETPGPLTS